MNQIDLWSGGHQINRGSKYIFNKKNNNRKCKLLCVVCKFINFQNNKKTKKYNLFSLGFSNNTLCYINGLEEIVNTFFLT